MATHWDTEVLTTCALDYMTWDNFYPPGIERVGQTVIRRFPVDQRRDVPSFDLLSAELHPRKEHASHNEQEKWMRAQGPISTQLLEFVAAEKETYDLFIFFTYLYATTYFGLPLVKEKAFLAPLAHDEWPIYFSIWDQFFALPRGFIFNTNAERAFLSRRFPHLRLEGDAIGVGIEPPMHIESDTFREKYSLRDPFLLYVGRVDEAKGCRTMFDYFLRQRAEGADSRKLVLIGTEVMPIPFHDEIIHLGFVSDEEKWAALTACEWLLMPSPHESLSIALLEAWSVGKPAIVNGRCDVLVDHCRRSNGGLWFDTYEEWRAILSGIDAHTSSRLGRQGQSYVQARYSWERVERDYLELVNHV